MKVTHVAALARDATIGKDGDMPWHYEEDLRHFKSTTMGTMLLMGRKTLDSIGRVLPQRVTIVLTSNPAVIGERYPRAVVATSVDAAFEKAREIQPDGRISVVGGAEAYTATLSRADELVLSFLPEEGGGDTFYPIKRWADLEDPALRQQVVRMLHQLKVVIAVLRYEMQEQDRDDIVSVGTDLLASVIETLALSDEEIDSAAMTAHTNRRFIDLLGKAWVPVQAEDIGRITVRKYRRDDEPTPVRRASN
jgi:dihydrofolate reductase